MKRFNPLQVIPVGFSQTQAAAVEQAITQRVLPPTDDPNKRILPIGTRVHCGLYGGRDGIIYQIHGEQSPGTCTSIANGVGVMGGTADFSIVWTGEGAHTTSVPEALVRDSVQWEIYHDQPIATADEIKAALAEAERQVAERAAAQKRKEEQRAAERAALPAKYPFLLPVAKGGRCTANLKLELQRTFPGVKFSVTQSRGSSYVSCRWELGPTSAEVDAIVGKYEEGRFDGMTDSFEYNHDNVFPDIFGGAHGVNTSRNYPPDIYERVGRDLCALQRVPYTGEYTRHLLGTSDDKSLVEHVNQVLSRTHWAVGAIYEGVQFNPVREAWSSFASAMFALYGSGWASRDNRPKLAPEHLAALIEHEAKLDANTNDHWCCIKFAQSATATAATAKGMKVTATKHTKQGYPIWVVQLDERVGREEFVRLRDVCKSLGGWYSSYRGGGAIPGFTFKTEAAAAQFAGVPPVAPAPAPAPAPIDRQAEDRLARPASATVPTVVPMDAAEAEARAKLLLSGRTAILPPAHIRVAPPVEPEPADPNVEMAEVEDNPPENPPVNWQPGWGVTEPAPPTNVVPVNFTPAPTPPVRPINPLLARIRRS